MKRKCGVPAPDRPGAYCQRELNHDGEHVSMSWQPHPYKETRDEPTDRPNQPNPPVKLYASGKHVGWTVPK